MIKLKDFLMMCDYSDCIFGIYVADREEPIEEIDNVKDKNELEEYLDYMVASIHPYNEDTIAVIVYID
jgi:hypothetical protein